jgi:hypothetical protein
MPEATGFASYLTTVSLRYLDNPSMPWYTGVEG